MNLSAIIRHLRPLAVSRLDYCITGTSLEWNSEAIQRPTDEEIAAAWPAVELALAKTARAAAIREDFAAACLAGITVGTHTFAADETSRNLFTGMTVMLTTAIATGQLSSSDPQTIHAIDGSPITLPAGSIIALLLSYGAAYKARFDQLHTRLAALAAASTVTAARDA